MDRALPVRYKGRPGLRPPDEVREAYYDLRAPISLAEALSQGFIRTGHAQTRKKARERIGVSEKTAKRWDEEKADWYGKKRLKAASDAELAVKNEAELSAEGRRGLTDFAYFCSHFLGLDAPYFFVEMSRIISGDPRADTALKRLSHLHPHLRGLTKPLLPPKLEPNAIRRLLIVIMPGVGKTTVICAYILWRITQERAKGNTRFAMTYGTKSQRLAERALRQIKDWMVNQEDLVKTYGRYQPDADDVNQLWSKSDVSVSGMGRGKEATLAVWASGSSIRGVRPHEAIWDDLIDADDALPERTKERLEWWDDNAARRVEPGGTLAVVGNFVAPGDFYHALAKRTYTFEGEDGEVVEEKAWHVIKYPAHDELRCPHDGQHPAYPVGCLLWPERWSYRELERVRQDNPSRFAIQFQLAENVEEETLVPELWVKGGAGGGGEIYPGCLDIERETWEKPEVRDPIIIATLDPSPTKFSSIQLWAYDPPFDWLIAYERRIMRSPDYPVVIAEWTQRARQMFGRLDAWIVEKTGSQYLHQTKEMEFLWGMLGVHVIAHDTQGKNKRNEEFGLWGFRNQFRWGRVRVPWAGGMTREDMRYFVEEHTAYPFSTTDDSVMGHWFYQLHKDKIPKVTWEPPTRDVPSWLRKEQ